MSNKKLFKKIAIRTIYIASGILLIIFLFVGFNSSVASADLKSQLQNLFNKINSPKISPAPIQTPVSPVSEPVATTKSYYIDANNGNDNNTGTIEKPFKTIQKARDAIRARNVDGITVYLRSGTFYLTEPLVFTEQDSGVSSDPNTYQSYPGEKAVISGGRKLNLSWKSYNHNGNSIYVANVGSLKFNSLFVDGNRAVRARTPNEGEFYANVVPIYRFWNKVSGDHFYTLSESEKNNLSKYSEWVYEGIEGYSLRGPQSSPFPIDAYFTGTLPVYRFYNSSAGTHFYTSNASERGAFELKKEWQAEGIAFYVFVNKKTNTLPLYKFTNANSSFYTTSESEMNSLKKNSSWEYKGIEGYVYSKTDGSEAESANQNITSAFYFGRGDINASWKNIGDIEIISFRRWEQSRFKINRVVGNKVYFQGEMPEGYGWDYGGYDRYYIENVFEGLDKPGEWYLDNKTGNLYYWPVTDISKSEFIVPVLTTLIKIGDPDKLTSSVLARQEFTGYVSNLNFKNLSFSYTDWQLTSNGYPGGATAFKSSDPAIYAVVKDSIFEGNDFSHIGAHAITVYSKNTEIKKNKFSDIGAGAIKIGRANFVDLLDYKYMASSVNSNSVIDNSIFDTGKVYKDSVGIAVYLVGKNQISHNLIYNTPYTGIFVGEYPRLDKGVIAGDNLIEYNEIYNVMKELNDGSGVYVVGNQPGTIVRNNKIHDILKTTKHIFDFALWGIYLEGETAQIRIEKNVVYRTTYGGLMFFNGINDHNYGNSAVNNIFVDGIDYQIFLDSAVNDTFNNNIVYYSKNKGKLFYTPSKNSIKISDKNIFYSSNELASVKLQVDEWKKYGFDSNSIVTDPLFVNYFADDYSLQKNSPAFGLGFQQIDLSGVGPR